MKAEIVRKELAEIEMKDTLRAAKEARAAARAAKAAAN